MATRRTKITGMSNEERNDRLSDKLAGAWNDLDVTKIERKETGDNEYWVATINDDQDS